MTSIRGVFCVVEPSRGSEIMAFGSFCGVIFRENRKIGLRCSAFERKSLRSLCEPFSKRRLWSGAPRFVATGMRIVLLRETGWAGVANENPLKPSWGASLGAARSVFGLEGRKVAKAMAHFGKRFCDEFMAPFLSMLHSIVFFLLFDFSWSW